MKYILLWILMLVATPLATANDITNLYGNATIIPNVLAKKIISKYKIQKQFANHVVTLAYKYQKPSFPRAVDILAVIGIESNYNPNAISELSADPAIGLTQIRPEAWSHQIKREDLATIDGQVKHSVNILSYYYSVVGSKEGAIKAYNLGLNGYLRNRKSPAGQKYINKYFIELQHLTNT